MAISAQRGVHEFIVDTRASDEFSYPMGLFESICFDRAYWIKRLWERLFAMIV